MAQVEITVTESGVVLLSVGGSSYPIALSADEAESIAKKLADAATRARRAQD